MKRPRGRPAAEAARPSRDEMVEAALHLLDEKGPAALTMRALAGRLGVTPMTIHHHFGDRAGLIEALADRAYGGVAATDSGPEEKAIAGLLRAYHSAILRCPGLVLLIFGQGGSFPRQAERITQNLTRRLRDAGLPEARARLWVHILVDFTHGAAIATAMAARGTDGGASSSATAEYAAALDEILRGIGDGA